MRERNDMFCVIQEIETKKPNKHGYPRELHSQFMKCTIRGQDVSYYYHFFSDERFARPIKKAYRISIHVSYRENGNVRKKQYPICTAGYYDLADDRFSLYDYGDSKIRMAADDLGVGVDTVYDVIDVKLMPLRERIWGEFRRTEEYLTHEEHERITTIYAAKKEAFNGKYESSGGDYDRCYDVFGKLQNKEALEKIEADYKASKEYEHQSQKNSRGYYENFYSNYGNGGYGSTTQDTGLHDTGDKAMLKKFYRTLSKAYHPDSNPGVNTSEEMKLLNQLKGNWGV